MRDERSLEEWAADETAAERTEQGLPPTVEDPVALDRLAVILTSATPGPSSAVRRGAVDGPGIGAVAGSTRRRGVRGSAPRHAAEAVQSSGLSAPARSKPKKKAGVAATTPAPNTSTPVEGVRREA